MPGTLNSDELVSCVVAELHGELTEEEIRQCINRVVGNCADDPVKLANALVNRFIKQGYLERVPRTGAETAQRYRVIDDRKSFVKLYAYVRDAAALRPGADVNSLMEEAGLKNYLQELNLLQVHVDVNLVQGAFMSLYCIHIAL